MSHSLDLPFYVSNKCRAHSYSREFDEAQVMHFSYRVLTITRHLFLALLIEEIATSANKTPLFIYFKIIFNDNK